MSENLTDYSQLIRTLDLSQKFFQQYDSFVNTDDPVWVEKPLELKQTVFSSYLSMAHDLGMQALEYIFRNQGYDTSKNFYTKDNLEKLETFSSYQELDLSHQQILARVKSELIESFLTPSIEV